jgi:hypothetical protein
MTMKRTHAIALFYFLHAGQGIYREYRITDNHRVDQRMIVPASCISAMV